MYILTLQRLVVVLAIVNIYVYIYYFTFQMLEAPDTNASTRALALRLWCFPFSPEDHQLLMHVKILSLVKVCMVAGLNDQPLAQTKSQRTGKAKEGASDSELNQVADRKLRQIARLVYRYIAIACIGNGDAEGPDHSATFDEFQSYGIGLMVADLRESIVALERKRKEYEESMAGEHLDEGGGNVGDQVALNFDPNIEGYQREEKFCYSMLLSLYLSAQTPAGEAYLSTPEMLHLQLQILKSGTLRLQRLVLRMLRRLVPHLNPDVFADAKVEELLVLEVSGGLEGGSSSASEDSGGEAFIYYLLNLIGEALEIEIYADDPLPEVVLEEEDEKESSKEQVAGEKETPPEPQQPKRALSDSEYAQMLQDEWNSGGPSSSRPSPSAAKALPATKPVSLPLEYRKRLKRWELKKKREMDIKQPSSQNYRDASVIFAEVAEMVMLLRYMANPGKSDGGSGAHGGVWAKLLAAAIDSSIKKLPALVDVAYQIIRPTIAREDLWRALASLCIVGA